MADTMMDFTADQEDSQEYILTELPDSKETQIVDSEEDQVRLF